MDRPKKLREFIDLVIETPLFFLMDNILFKIIHIHSLPNSLISEEKRLQVKESIIGYLDKLITFCEHDWDSKTERLPYDQYVER